MHIRSRLVRFHPAMKKRIIATALAAVVGGLAGSACEGHHHHEKGERDRLEDACRQLTSCQTCTPVSGCGWCQTGVDEGTCAADPDECSGAAAFSWTWNPSACVVTPDGAAPAVPDAASTVAAPDDGADAGTAR
jgi:hypothetical protein